MTLTEKIRLSQIKNQLVDGDEELAEMLGNPTTLEDLNDALQDNADVAGMIYAALAELTGSNHTRKEEVTTQQQKASSGLRPGQKMCPAGLHIIGARWYPACKQCDGPTEPVQPATVQAPAVVPTPAAHPTVQSHSLTDEINLYVVPFSPKKSKGTFVQDLDAWYDSLMAASVERGIAIDSTLVHQALCLAIARYAMPIIARWRNK